jgi:outer membrane murein-binding lipoprotein Lpp
MRTLAVVFASLLLVGCSQKPSGPTYAEAVATYQAEVALLDSLHLEKKRLDELYAEKTKGVVAIAGDSLSKKEIDSLLRNAEISSQRQLTAVVNEKPTEDTVESALERAIARNRVGYNSQLEVLESKIKAQLARVEAARQARDSLAP